MNAFDQASRVETEGMARLMPFIEERAYQGRFIKTAKGALSKALQAEFGDVLMNTDADTVYGVEVKIEQKWTGNLFLETWSNRNLESKQAHGERGQKPGWLISQRADLLFYYFLDVDALLVIPVFALKQWAFGTGDTPGHIYAWKEVRQGKYAQRNDTWGRLVNVDALARDIPLRRFSVRQLSLDIAA